MSSSVSKVSIHVLSILRILETSAKPRVSMLCDYSGKNLHLAHNLQQKEWYKSKEREPKRKQTTLHTSRELNISR